MDQLLDVVVARIRTWRPDLHPFGAARPLCDGKRRLHPDQSSAGLRRVPGRTGRWGDDDQRRTEVKRAIVALLFGACVCSVAAASGASAASATGHEFKFDPTVNAPWAMEGDEGEFERAGRGRRIVPLCPGRRFRSRTERSGSCGGRRIIGDQVNNSGFSNFGCTTPQNETSIAVNPRSPKNLVAGANDYRVCCDFTALNDATGLGVLLIRRWQDVGQRPGARPDRRDRRDRLFEEVRCGGRSRHGLRFGWGRLLREHRLQPGQLRSQASWSVGRRTAAGPGVRRTSSPTRTAGNLLQRQGLARGRLERAGRGHMDPLQPRPTRRRVPRIADRCRVLEGRRQDVESAGLARVRSRASVRPGLAGAIRA